jgi:UDP-N-acetylmuramate dehydrogenase
MTDLKEELNLSKVLINEPMKKHTTFKVGGPVDIMVIPKNVKEIKNLFKYIKTNNYPFYVMGNGSNLVVKDKGIRGIVIKVLDNFNSLSAKDDIIEAGAGVLLSKLANFAMKESLSGLEFASGIPGSLGGAVVMNAGAYGGQTSDVIEQTTYIDVHGNIEKLQKDEHEFGYRKSYFSKGGNIVLEVKLRLIPSSNVEIKSKMDAYTAQRVGKQPLSVPSAGSVFKRPEGYFTGKLIQDAGLKGCSIGGAQVSEKHSGFIINNGDATAWDVIQLIYHVQEQVKTKFGVELETEVKIIGED